MATAAALLGAAGALATVGSRPYTRRCPVFVPLKAVW